jgi:hypothetical protein
MNLLLKLYFILPHDRSFGFFSKTVNRIVALFLKSIFDLFIPNYFLKSQKYFPCGLNKRPRDTKVLVSFTSFPGRIQDVWIVVECLFRQNFKADKIVLWLSRDEFEGIKLPEKLMSQCDRGLEIVYVDDNLSSHKKYYYAVEKYVDWVIITVDDDVYYHKNVLSALVEAHLKFPNFIVANRAHEITFDEKTGFVMPYRNWKHNIKKDFSSFLLVPTGVGGVLYPPKTLSKDILNPGIFKSICLYADDLWLKIGSLKTKTKVYSTSFYKQEFISVGNTQKTKLVTRNSLNGENDVQFKNLLEYFKLGNLEEFRKT